MRMIFLTILLGVSFGAIPKWYVNNELAGYPSSQYYIGVSEGSTAEEAQANAQAVIAAQLSVTVESTVQSFIEELNSDDQSFLTEGFKRATTSTVNETVTGIEVVKQKKAKKVYYVFSALDKSKFLAGLTAELDQLWKSMEALVEDARSQVSKGNIFTALENYTDAQEFVLPFYTKKAFHDALSDFPYVITENFTLAKLVSEIRGILAGVTVEVVSGDRQSADTGKGLEEAINFHVYYQSSTSDQQISIPNMPMVIKYEDGTVAERGVTDIEGNIETDVTAVPFSGKNGKIYARPNLVRLPDLYRTYLKNTEGVATYSLGEMVPVRFALQIRDEAGKRLPKVEAKLTKSIEKNGGIISADASIMLKGTVDVVSEKEVEGKNGVQYMVSSELSLFMIVNATGENVASFSGRGKGVSSKNYTKARAASFQKISIKKKELAEMLSTAGDY